MNQVLSLVQAARQFPGNGRSLNSNQMLAELLALHEEMIVQLRLECLEAAGSAHFLAGMIADHQKTAAALRLKLAQRARGIVDDDVDRAGEAGSPKAYADRNRSGIK